MTSDTYDAIVVGAGHNGLICAAYLAGAGLRIVVVERRAHVGGAAVTEEIAPGYRASTASYALSLLRPDVFNDLGLKDLGVEIFAKDPQMFVPLPDGAHFFVWRDQARTIEEIRRLHRPDADSYLQWSRFWDRATQVLRPLVEEADPPIPELLEADLARRGLDDIWRLAVAGSVAETVGEFFDHPAVQGAFASQGIIGTDASPFASGTAWVMAYHYLGGEVHGSDGTWGYVSGGMGALTRGLRRAAEQRGAEVRTEAEAAEILVGPRGVEGVRLATGEQIGSRTVVSNADPRRTLALLPSDAVPRELAEKVDGWRYDGCVVKVNLALAELPDFTALGGTEVGPQHRGTIEISPSLEYLDAAHRDGASGRYPEQPFMEMFIQSAVDPSLTDHGHVLSAFTQWAPRIGASAWAARKSDVQKAVIAAIARYAPNFEHSVVEAEVLGPPDLEERFGLTGGDIFHGSILPEQSFGNRFAYRSAVSGLYLCGSGARPGGGVMGAAGRNAARVILTDLSKRSSQRDVIEGRSRRREEV